MTVGIQADELSPGKGAVPRHVAIIMDGNGRWAESRGLPRSLGHKNGAEAVKEAIEGAAATGVDYLTLYAFSSENWNRPASEVNDLMGLLRLYLKKEVASLHKEGIKILVIGQRTRLAPDITAMIERAEALTAHNNRMTLVIALNYGAREEITEAVKDIVHRVEAGDICVDDICEDTVSQALYTRQIPDPDLVIRTSGEQRLSNFLMWQAAYAEFLFLDIYWPDFKAATFKEAVEVYQLRDRRFGARS